MKKKYIELGNIMLKAVGEAGCLKAYDTTDPEWVGRTAIMFGDINTDGTLN